MQPQESTVHQLVGTSDLAPQGEVRLELSEQLAHGRLNQQVRSHGCGVAGCGASGPTASWRQNAEAQPSLPTLPTLFARSPVGSQRPGRARTGSRHRRPLPVRRRRCYGQSAPTVPATRTRGPCLSASKWRREGAVWTCRPFPYPGPTHAAGPQMPSPALEPPQNASVSWRSTPAWTNAVSAVSLLAMPNLSRACNAALTSSEFRPGSPPSTHRC